MKIGALREDIEHIENRAMMADMFISAVRKYTRAKKLTPRMLEELISTLRFIRRKRPMERGCSASPFPKN